MTEEAMLEEHRKTFKGFLKVAAVGTVVIVVALALMGLFLV